MTSSTHNGPITPGIIFLPLESEISVLSAQLPEPFQKDPADQTIVATSFLHDIPPATNDDKILSFPRTILFLAKLIAESGWNSRIVERGKVR